MTKLVDFNSRNVEKRIEGFSRSLTICKIKNKLGERCFHFSNISTDRGGVLFFKNFKTGTRKLFLLCYSDICNTYSPSAGFIAHDVKVLNLRYTYWRKIYFFINSRRLAGNFTLVNRGKMFVDLFVIEISITNKIMLYMFKN